MDTEFIQALTGFFTVFNQPLVVLALAIIGFVFLPRLKYIQKIFKPLTCNEYGDIKKVLLQLTTGIETISGNDLTHIKNDIACLGTKMDAINMKFIEHDDQAKAILTRANDIWDKVK